MMVKYLPELDLVKRLSEGDEKAFRIVFDRFHGKIYQFAFSFLKDKDQSEEIVQDTFLSFWLNRENLDCRQPVAPYLFTIARRTLIDAWRKAANLDSFRQRIYKIATVINNDTLDTIFLNDLERVVNEGLLQLNKQQQQIYDLSRHEGLSYEEIAVRLKISKNTVKYHLVNALKIMRTHLSENDILYTVLYILYCNVDK